MAAFRLLVEYEGTRFSGWQRQGKEQEASGVRTVTGSLEKAIRAGGFIPRSLVGAGRTDAGVHALGQVAHLHLDAADNPDATELRRVFEERLPSDLAVRDVVACSLDFNARHDAVARIYLYQLTLRRSGLAKPFVWWPKQALDPGRLARAWSAFEGFHDVSAFADRDRKEDPRCEIRRAELLVDGALVLLRVEASHFLRRQVRRMVGAAVGVAAGDDEVQTIRADLASPSREAALRRSRRTAPPSGLLLERVLYPNDPPAPPLRAVTLVP